MNHTQDKNGIGQFPAGRVRLDMGLEYICITDHSQSSPLARGLDIKAMVKQMEEVRRLDEQLEGIDLLVGSEVEILPDGRVDFDDSLLPELDFVAASVHTTLNGSRQKMTTCLLKVMDNPYVTCLGHPTGRIYSQREAMDLDMAAIIAHAAQTGTALEINANPSRLDLKDVHARMAVEAGVKLAINTDTHHTAGFGLIPCGEATAARAWVTKKDVLNTMPLAQLKRWIKKKRRA